MALGTKKLFIAFNISNFLLENNKVIRIEVGEGSYKPYYLKSKGMKSNGVYVRQGASSVQASPEQIRRMIKDSDGDIFEEMRTVVQELSFEEAERTFMRYKVDFSEEKYISLGLRNIDDDQYTNLAMLLSDQCQHTIKIAVFGDESNIIFKDAKEFCIEFISIGGLLPGLSADDIRNGISQPRNRKLAEIFHRLRLIESYGTGIRKIYALYKNCAVQPRIEVTANTFKLVLPNMNARSVITELPKNIS